MVLKNYIIIIFFILLTSIYLKIRRLLNIISIAIISNVKEDKIKEITKKPGWYRKGIHTKERNSIEIVMQPMWYLNSIIVLLLLWLYLIYSLFKDIGWWSLLFAVAIYLISGLFSYLIFIPSNKSIIKFFHSITSKRLNNKQRYKQQEIKYLIIAYNYLNKILDSY